MSIKSDNLINFFLKYQKWFILYKLLFSQFIHNFSYAYFENYFNTFKRNYEKIQIFY